MHYLTVDKEHRQLGLARFIIAERFSLAANRPGIARLAVPQLIQVNNLPSYYEQLGFIPGTTGELAYIWRRPVVTFSREVTAPQ